MPFRASNGRRLVLCLAALLWSGAAAGTAVAQRVGLGVRAGYTRASLQSPLDQTDPANGWAFGVFAPVEIDEAISIVPELLYVRKGGQFSVSGGEDVPAEETEYKLDYLALPVLGRVAFPLSTHFDAFIGGGPYAALQINQVTDTRLPDEELYANSDEFDRVDFGLVLEGGLDVPIDGSLGGQALLVSVRYDYGLANLIESDDATRDQEIEPEIATRALLFTVGLRF